MSIQVGTMISIGTRGWWQDDGIADAMSDPGTLGFWQDYTPVEGTFTPGVAIGAAVRILKRNGGS